MLCSENISVNRSDAGSEILCRNNIVNKLGLRPSPNGAMD